MKSLSKVRLPRPRQMSAAEERLVQQNESTLNENFDRIAVELNTKSVTRVTNLNNAHAENDNVLSFYSFSDTAANGPGYAGFCVCFSYSYPRAAQYAFAVSTARVSMRSRDAGGTWGSWTHINP